jgi:PKD domain-containing protein
MSSRLVGLAAALALLTLPQAASASPGWVAPIDFPVPASASNGTDEVRYQSGGIATEAFLQVESLAPLQTAVHFGTVAPGGGYGDQLTIASSTGSTPTEPQIAVAPDGAAVATWIELEGSNPETALYSFRAAYRPVSSSTWEAPVTIATDSERPTSLAEHITRAISANGTAAVGIQRFRGLSTGAHKQPDYLLEVATHPAGGTWQAPVRLSATAESVTDLSLAFDGQGDLTAAYMQRFFEGATEGEDRNSVITDRRPASSGLWGPEEDITGSEPQWSADALQLGENEDGDAVIAYQYVGGIPASADAWAVTRDAGAGGAWSAPQQLATKAASSVPIAAGVTPEHAEAYVLYNLQGESSGESCVGVARLESTFFVRACVSPTDEEAHDGSIAFIGYDAYFAWSANVPGEPANGSVQSGRWLGASAFAPPEAAINLDQSGQSYGAPTLTSDGLGSVVAFYDAPDGVLRAAAYDNSPPILLGASVPATATVGEPASFSASFADLWSSLGAAQPTWSFGDGSAPVAGASATHTFSAPGMYTITLGAADAFGNATSASYSIAVTPAAVGKSPAPSQPPTVTLQLPVCAKKLSKKACNRFRASRAAWQTLTGQVADPTSSGGIADVQVAVYLTSGARIEGLLGKRFHKTTKAKARTTFGAATVSGAHWSLRLPKLKPGTYTILVRAADRAGHVSMTIAKTVKLH